jgi:hypothetical protein
MSDITNARSYRANIERARKFYLSEKDLAFKHGNKIEWEDLEELPSWVFWETKKIDQLINIAGAIFMLPSIRLWLESERIETVQSTIGKDIYDFLLKYTYIDIEPITCEEIEDIPSILQTTGVSVLLSALKESIRPWFSGFPQAATKRISQNVAIKLLNHALFVRDNTHKSQQTVNIDLKESL